MRGCKTKGNNLQPRARRPEGEIGDWRRRRSTGSGALRSGFKVRTARPATERPVPGLNLDCKGPCGRPCGGIDFTSHLAARRGWYLQTSNTFCRDDDARECISEWSVPSGMVDASHMLQDSWPRTGRLKPNGASLTVALASTYFFDHALASIQST